MNTMKIVLKIQDEEETILDKVRVIEHYPDKFIFKVFNWAMQEDIEHEYKKDDVEFYFRDEEAFSKNGEVISSATTRT
jgi:hypothetical protein